MNTTREPAWQEETTAASSRTERVFMDEGPIRVTSARFLVPGNTFAMSGVTSVRHIEKDPALVFGYLLIIGGVFLCLSPSLIAMGVIFVLGGAIYLWKGKGRYDVRLQTASGEIKALTSRDKDFVRRVVYALNEAIVYRG
ncbi:DUF6232 family protein [Caballeronia sp. TF1N1]|uniref:DUF6232 family protein n=1 Tax=Caballeronia sp. TF1N1 TaxID=2878153 RepID=UPI001FCFD5B0|nr:DUF6232 family protein [Caballeronia sp. TF1N1]